MFCYTGTGPSMAPTVAPSGPSFRPTLRPTSAPTKVFSASGYLLYAVYRVPPSTDDNTDDYYNYGGGAYYNYYYGGEAPPCNGDVVQATITAMGLCVSNPTGGFYMYNSTGIVVAGEFEVTQTFYSDGSCSVPNSMSPQSVYYSISCSGTNYQYSFSPDFPVLPGGIFYVSRFSTVLF